MEIFIFLKIFFFFWFYIYEIINSNFLLVIVREHATEVTKKTN